MTIDKAIKSLTPLLREFRARCTPDQRDAIKLGIEALKAIRVFRSANESWLSLNLPGETKDDKG